MIILNQRSFFSSFGYALTGIVTVFRTQRNMKVHGVAAILAVTMGLFLRLSTIEWVAIVCSIFFVLAAEAVNTAIEAAVNLCTEEFHPWAKVAKDCAAGAVLLAAVNSVIVGILVFGRHV